MRPGVALYGANPTPGKPNPMRTVVTLQGAHRADARRSSQAQPSATARPGPRKRPTRLAIVSVGYADGFLRAASASDARPGAEAIVAGQRCPLAGRVSMDLIAIDVTDMPAGKAARGDLVTLLGDGIGVDDLATAPARSATRC